MRYVYILKFAEDTQLYVGTTNNLEKRIAEHQNGKVAATKHRGAHTLIFYEAFTNEQDAWKREKYFKTGWGRKHIKSMLSETIKD